MNLVKLYPYNLASESAKNLADILSVLRVKPDGMFTPKIGQVVVNWGNSTVPSWYDLAKIRGVTILNAPEAIKIASNKLLTFITLESAGIRIPAFTTEKRTAQYWLNEGKTIVERHVLTGSSAEGVRIVNLEDPEMAQTLEDAPLYTMFLPKTREFRVHVFNGQVIDYAEKKKMSEDRRPENFNKYICSNEMGWVFCRENIKHIDSVKEEAIKAINALGLDFGAVDVVFYNELPYILEVNTAPGMVGTTLKRYANAIRSFVGLPDLVDEEEITTDGEADSLAVNETLVENNETVSLTLDVGTAKKLKELLIGLGV